MAVTELDVIERQTGARPPTCPWKAFEDPVVRDTLELYRASRIGSDAHLASVRVLNPPHHLWLGVQHYSHALQKVREELAAQREKRRKK